MPTEGCAELLETKATDGHAGDGRAGLGVLDWTAVSSSLEEPRRLSRAERRGRMRAIGESVTESGGCKVSRVLH